MLMVAFLSFIDGLALALQTINAGSSANGVEIANPGDKGRAIEFSIICGDLTGVTVLKIVVEGKRSDTDAWETVQDNAGNDLQFTAAETIAGGDLDNGMLRGTVPIIRLPGDPLNKPYYYKSYRLAVETVTGANITIAAIYRIVDLFKEAATDTDDLVHKVLPAG